MTTASRPVPVAMVDTPPLAPVIVATDSGKAMRELYRELFAPMGYMVITLDCSRADPTLIAEERPDAILLGCFQGCARTGWHFLRALDFDPVLWSVPVVISPSIGTLSAMQIQHLRHAGYGVLTRPFTMPALMATVTHAVGQSHIGDTPWRGRPSAHPGPRLGEPRPAELP